MDKLDINTPPLISNKPSNNKHPSLRMHQE